jgi:V/A-type H+-transporting ATPase subunit C
MLLPLGSVSIEDTQKAFASKDYSAFPTAMAAAIAEAEDALAATGDPQKVDLIIDKATFADMLTCAAESGVLLARRLVCTKIDLVNATVALRLVRMRLGQRTAALFDEAFIEGGTLDKETLSAALESEEKLCEALAYGSCSDIAALIGEGADLGAVERRADNILCSVAREAKYAPFGVEVAIGYIFALEYEVKNIRIILAGKEAGLSPEIIRERLRECYV